MDPTRQRSCSPLVAGASRGVIVAAAAVAVALFCSLSAAEERRPGPPTAIAPRKLGPPASLQDIRERARKRSDEQEAAGAQPEKETGSTKGTAPVAAPPGAPLPGQEKLTPTTVEEGLGAEFIPPTRGQQVNLNFTDVELTELVRAMSVATGRRFIIGGKVRSIKTSIFSPAPVTAGEAYQAFLSVLASNGMTVVPSGRYLKVVESSEAVASPVPICADGEDCEVGDRMITRLHRLQNVSAEDMGQVLGRFKTADGDITAYAPTNTLIITDYARNVRRMLRIVQELDVEGVGTSIWVEPVYYSSAQEIADILSQVFQPEGGTGGSKTAPARRAAPARTKTPAGKAAEGGATTVGESASGERLRLIIPDERTNQLIIVASERTYLQMLELIRALDTPLGDADGEIRVHKLQNAIAEELASTLSSLAGKTTTTKAPGKAGAKAAASKAATAASLFEGEVQVTADKATNSLIIIGSARDYLSLRQVIDQLDIPRRQVFVEAVILEVSLDGQRRWGVAFHGGAADDTDLPHAAGTTLGLFGTSFDSGRLQSLILDPSVLQGLALGIRGPEIEGSDILPGGLSIPAFGVVIQALQDSSDVNVLSTPHILATDNEEAEIQVGQNVPVSQGFAAGLGSLAGLASAATGTASAARSLGSMGSLLPTYSIGREDVGIKLSMTPHVNQADQVRLEVELEVSEVSGESDMGPIIGQRLAKTKCVVEDQQTVVLGGLVTDNVVNGVQKVPVLGDIPLIGRLFKRTTRRVTKRNLLIFLTPYIVRDSADFRRIFARKMQERREFIDRYTAFEYHEVQPDIDYDRTNGMLEEIRQALTDLDRIEEEERALESIEEPEHVARSPIGRVTTTAAGGEGGDEGGGEPIEDEGPRALPPTFLQRRGGQPGPPTAIEGSGDEGGGFSGEGESNEE